MAFSAPVNSSPSCTGKRYLLVTPCRDEAKYGRAAHLTVWPVKLSGPALWIIVDDGSKDETPQILARVCRPVPLDPDRHADATAVTGSSAVA